MIFKTNDKCVILHYVLEYLFQIYQALLLGSICFDPTEQGSWPIFEFFFFKGNDKPLKREVL